MPARIEPVWVPDAETVRKTRLWGLMQALGRDDYETFAELCLDDPERHWRTALSLLDIRFDPDFDALVDFSRGKAWPRWFPGGGFNCVAPVLARAEAADADAALALIAESEAGEVRRFTRRSFAAAVRRMAGSLQAHGVGRGDRVAMMLPNVAEAAMLPLACAWLGAITVPLYSGFGPRPIVDRVVHSGARTLATCSSTLRNGKRIGLLEAALAAAADCPELRRILVLDREEGGDANLSAPAVPWDPLAAGPIPSPPIASDPDDPVMIIYTSGTTGRPKGTVHTHAGFPLRIAYDLAFLFDVREGDRFFWFSDMGWMIGPMVVFGPQLLGATAVLYDGGPAVPGAARLFETAGRHAVTHFGSAPTLTRSWITAGAEPTDDFRRSVHVLMTAGEVIGPDAFDYLFKALGGGACPVINYTGGTEVSGGLMTNLPIRPIAPCVFNAPAPGVALSIRAADGRPIPPESDEPGELAIENVFPGMTQGLWQDAETYLETYWTRFPGAWSHGDLVQRRGGYWDLRGRADDVMKIAGRRIGPAEVEAAAADVEGLTGVVAVGLPDARTGEALHLFVVGDGEGLGACVAERVVARLGKAFRPAGVHRVPDLPRTRNNKIMRRVVRKAALGEAPGDLSALDNPDSVAAIPRIETEA